MGVLTNIFFRSEGGRGQGQFDFFVMGGCGGFKTN